MYEELKDIHRCLEPFRTKLIALRKRARRGTEVQARLREAVYELDRARVRMAEAMLEMNYDTEESASGSQEP